MFIPALRAALERCLARKQAVYAVVAILGTTEEGAVDPLAEILALRGEFMKRGLAFAVHADAAWGGYFATMLRRPPSTWVASTEEGSVGEGDILPAITLREETARQLRALEDADSITVDPHKAGYIPYPA